MCEVSPLQKGVFNCEAHNFFFNNPYLRRNPTTYKYSFHWVAGTRITTQCLRKANSIYRNSFAFQKPTELWQLTVIDQNFVVLPSYSH